VTILYEIAIAFIGIPIAAFAVYVFVRMAAFAYFKTRNEFNKKG
jgi:hypothetical protein